MKPLILLLSLAAITFSFGCSKKPVYKTVVRTYQRTDFSPNKVDQEITKNFNITIMPVDHREIDKETYLAALRYDAYETEAVSSWKNKAAKASDSETERILYLFEKVDDLITSNYFSPEVGTSIKKQLIGKADLWDGSEIISLKDNLPDYPEDFNPYNVNGKYLTCFRVIISNETDDLVKIGSDNFQIISGTELLTPLKMGYFDDNIVGTSERMKNIFRMNLPDAIEVVPKTQTIKYIAVPSIDLQNDKLSVKLILKDKVFNYDFTVLQESVTNTVTFQQFKIQVLSYANSPKLYYIVVKQGNRVFSLDGKTLFLFPELTNEPISVYCLTTAGGGDSYGKFENVIPSKAKNFTIKVPMFQIRVDSNN